MDRDRESDIESEWMELVSEVGQVIKQVDCLSVGCTCFVHINRRTDIVIKWHQI